LSDFRKRFIELLETEYIHPKVWFDIVKIADFETLYYIKDDVMEDSKYGTKDDYLDDNTRKEILDRIDNRLYMGSFFVEKWFGDLMF
jgi:hypothetical protein